MLKAKLKLETGNQKSSMAVRRPFWKWHQSIPIKLYPYTRVMCYWRVELMLKVKLNLVSRDQNTQYGRQAPVFKMTSLKNSRILPIVTKKIHTKFVNKNVTANLSYALQTIPYPATKNTQYGCHAVTVKVTSLEITRLPSIHTHKLCAYVLLNLGGELQNKTKKIEFENQNNPIWPPGGYFLKVKSLKINRLLPITASNMHMKYETDRQREGQCECSISSTKFNGRWYNTVPCVVIIRKFLSINPLMVGI